MYASSVSSTESNDGGVVRKLKSFGQSSKPDIRIHLKDAETRASIMTYSTSDKIEGTVSITSPTTTILDKLDIKLIGSSRAIIQRMTPMVAMNSLYPRDHTFLVMPQPIRESAFPPSRILKAGQTYNFDFVFVLPEQLVSNVCEKAENSPAVHQAHLNLPPSMGDGEIAGRGDELLDDFAPDMASVRYGVVVKLVEARDGQTVERKAVRKVRILPAVAEQPPLDAGHSDEDYILRCEKDIKKGVLRNSKLGRLVAEVVQPKAIELPSPQSTSQAELGTMATVMLRFDPTETTSQPPRLGTLNAKLKINTFYASTTRAHFPSRKSVMFDADQHLFVNHASMPSRCVAGVEWTWHSHQDASEIDQVESGRSSPIGSKHAIPNPSDKYNNNGFYTAAILVPINLPKDKVFVPTFHNCLISRVYHVHISLGIHAVTMGAAMELKVPFQITSRGSLDPPRRNSLTAEQLAEETRQVEEFFEPRTVMPLPDERVGRSYIPGVSREEQEQEHDDLPPQYDAFPRNPVMGVPVIG